MDGVVRRFVNSVVNESYDVLICFLIVVCVLVVGLVVFVLSVLVFF